VGLRSSTGVVTAASLPGRLRALVAGAAHRLWCRLRHARGAPQAARLAAMAAKSRAAGAPGRPRFPALPGAGSPAGRPPSPGGRSRPRPAGPPAPPAAHARPVRAGFGRAVRRPHRAAQVLRRYTRTARGANTTTMPIAHSTVLTAASATGPPIISPRDAVARSDIGLTFTNACSQPGIVSVGTSRLLANTRGNIAVKPKS